MDFVVDVVEGMVVDNRVVYPYNGKQPKNILVDQMNGLGCFLWVFFGCLKKKYCLNFRNIKIEL